MSENLEAEVLATYGRGLLLQLPDGRAEPARPFGRRLSIVCGDRVRYEHDAHGKLFANEVLPRRSALWRSNARGDSEVVLANLDLLSVILAPTPAPDFFMVDRYLCAAESAGLTALVVLNKSDLEAPRDAAIEFANYEALGYPVLRVGARAGSGMDELAARLAPHVSALVGQSGVGKSSLIQRLAIDGDLAITGALASDDEGRHTTTASRRYRLQAGGLLMDSPGVRDFAPSIDHLEPTDLGFVELRRRAGSCRFQDCRHLEEPGCAIRAAVADGGMSARRYESYRRVRRLFERLNEARPHSQRRRHR